MGFRFGTNLNRVIACELWDLFSLDGVWSQDKSDPVVLIKKDGFFAMIDGYKIWWWCVGSLLCGKIQKVKSVLRLHQRPRALQSLKSCALVVVYVFINACLKQFKSSTCRRHWTKKQHTVTGLTIFKLHRLLVPKPGEVLGLAGTNGIGKSTALKILSGSSKPNLGHFNNPLDWQEILTYF
ncbi:hypothetical protein ACFX13_037686 [Malus domestica]